MKKSEQKRLRESLSKIFPRATGNMHEELKGKTQQERMDEIIDRLVTPEQRKRSEGYLAQLSGRSPLHDTPPDDMPALEKIKLYARSGYQLHHIGTDEDFERVWEEAFPDKKDGKK
jgi:hypothetical protein